VSAAGADGLEGAGRRRGLAVVVVAPAGDREIRALRAGVSLTGGDLEEEAIGRRAVVAIRGAAVAVAAFAAASAGGIALVIVAAAEAALAGIAVRQAGGEETAG